MLLDTGNDGVKKQRNAEYTKHINDPVLSSLKMESIRLLFCKWCRYRWPRYLVRVSVAARLLGLRIRIPPGAWMSVSCDCRVLSGRDLCVGTATLP
jgi:hypothetical protein